MLNLLYRESINDKLLPSKWIMVLQFIHVIEVIQVANLIIASVT